MEGPEKKVNKREIMNKAAAPVAIFLAGMLANHVMEGPGKRGEPMQYPNETSESYTSDYDTTYSPPDNTDYQPGDVDNYEFAAPPEAVAAIGQLDKSLGLEFVVTPEQRAQVGSTVEAYVAAHPAIIGKSGMSPDGKTMFQGASHDPLYDLWEAATKQSMNPLLRGLLLEELSSRMKQGVQ